MTGVWPWGAQVRLSAETREKPLSSSNASVAPSARHFFYPRPVGFDPGLNGRVIPLDRLPDGTPTWLLEIAVGLLTTAFSLVISHVGATIVMVPVAINIALAAGGNPTSAALIVALSASNNFMTASNPVMSMIVGPAGYSAKELWRVGGPLSLIYTVVVVLMVNLLF